MRSSIGAAPRAAGSRAGARGPAAPRDGSTGRDIGRLLISCPGRPGIIAAVSRFLYESGASILESQQYPAGPSGGTFFLLAGFHLPGLSGQFSESGEESAALAGLFSMRWTMTPAAEVTKAAARTPREAR